MDAHFAVSLQSQHLRDTAARRMPGSNQQWQKGDGVALTIIPGRGAAAQPRTTPAT